MKQFLILLSSIIISTISTNTFANFNQNTTFTDNLKTNNNDNKTLLLNNKYGYLSDSDWITNQSTADHKFYSYDSKHADYQLSSGINARNVFFVDNDGKLQYDSKLVLEKDENDIKNTKSQMINYKKITTIKNDYNPYSKSAYSNQYFNGDNTDWQYLQFGGVNKHIDVSNQLGADKIEHSNSLSETSGLYYIVKAVIENKISQSIAINLWEYFINQSSLKILNKKLILQMFKTMIINKNVFNFIKSLPFTNDNKNYSLNYIFDSNSNLIKIYYNKWDKNNIVIDFNNEFLINKSFNGTELSMIINYPGYNPFSGRDFDYVNYEYTNVICWKEFENNWNDFVKNYPSLNFGSDDFINIWASGYGTDVKRGSELNFQTNQISEQKYKSYFGEVKFIYNFTIPMNPFLARVYADSWFWIYHDQKNIYLNYAAALASDLAQEGTHLSIKVNKLIFNGV